MTAAEFKLTLNRAEPPKNLNPLLEALWYDAKGYWHKSHEIAQGIETENGLLIHAYLHRKEGDLINAEYWYHRAGRKMPENSLEQEWENLVAEFTNNIGN